MAGDPDFSLRLNEFRKEAAAPGFSTSSLGFCVIFLNILQQKPSALLEKFSEIVEQFFAFLRPTLE